MSVEKYREIEEEIERLTRQRREVLEAEYSRRTGAVVGDLVRDTRHRYRAVSTLVGGRGHVGVLVGWGSDHWPYSGRDLPWIKVRPFKKDGSPSDRLVTFFEWEKEPPPKHEEGAVGAVVSAA